MRAAVHISSLFDGDVDFYVRIFWYTIWFHLYIAHSIYALNISGFQFDTMLKFYLSWITNFTRKGPFGLLKFSW